MSTCVGIFNIEKKETTPEIRNGVLYPNMCYYHVTYYQKKMEFLKKRSRTTILIFRIITDRL